MTRYGPVVLLLAFAAMVLAQEPAATPPPGDKPPAKVGASARAPTLLSKVDANYSDEARRRKIEGICLVTLIVDANGKPQNLKVTKCVDPSLEQPSIDAVRQYRFNPAVRKEDGKAVPVSMTVEISYRLYDRDYSHAGFCEHWATSASPVRFSILPPPDAVKDQPDSNGLYSLNKEISAPTPSKVSDQGFCKAAREIKDDLGCTGIVDLNEKGKVLKVESMHCSATSVEEPLTRMLEKSQFFPSYYDGKQVQIRFALQLKYFVNPPKQ